MSVKKNVPEMTDLLRFLEDVRIFGGKELQLLLTKATQLKAHHSLKNGKKIIQKQLLVSSLSLSISSFLLASENMYFLLFQDMSTLDLDEFRFKGANITSMRLIDPSNPDVMSIMAEWGIMETNNLRSPLLGMRAIKVMY